MSISSAALKRSRFTVVAAIGVIIAGVVSLFGFPATEEPTVPFRTAIIEAYLPGASTDRMEQLIAQPIEERARQIAEVKTVETTIRPGATVLVVTLQPGTKPDAIPAVWQRLRAKMSDAQSVLPAGVVGPKVNDDYGRVSVLTLALTGKGYTSGQLQDAARKARLRLQAVPGAEQVTLYGAREDRIYVTLSPMKLSAAGLTQAQVAQLLAARNAITPSGEIASERALALETSGELPDAASVSAVQIPLPAGGSVALGSLGEVVQTSENPPTTAAIFNGQPAVVLGVSMSKGLNVNDFVSRLTDEVKHVQADLPAGMKLGQVTNQGEVVTHDLLKVGQVFVETIFIVMAVVVMFLGWRAGLVTGLIVPLTVLGTLLFMRVTNIELHSISIAAIIISLGLFVDNGIVIIEDYQRRTSSGEDKLAAAEAAGRTMFGPLLVSSLAIIFAFVPLVAGESETAEYMRSLAIVLTATLLISLFLAVTVTVVAAKMFAGAGGHHEPETGLIVNVRRWYVSKIGFILRRPALVAVAMFTLLACALTGLSFLPSELLAPSARNQLQMTVELSPGTSTQETLSLANQLSRRLNDNKLYPELSGNTIYVGDSGPRFILGLNPPIAASHKAYAVLNLDPKADLNATLIKIKRDMQANFPQARIEPKRFSLGASESGTAAFRLTGPDRKVLEAAAVRLKAKLEATPGMTNVRDDAEGRILRVKIDVDQTRAQAAGLSSADIANALETAYSGTVATAVRQGDIQVPVIVRAEDGQRVSMDALAAMPVMGPRGPVYLGEVARITLADQPSVLNRRNELPVITVTARHPHMTAQAIVDSTKPVLDTLNLPSGHSLQLGGELEESVEANKGLATYFPVALLGMAALFLWQFGSVRKTVIIIASMPFVLIGATLGLFVTQQPFSFSATLGLLALAGIIVNNAVLLLERIAEERANGKTQTEAVAAAAEVRLRPIVMTKLTCILGLMPLFIFGSDLWRPLAAAMIGGLLLGTLITLVLIPALYALLFNAKADTKEPAQ